MLKLISGFYALIAVLTLVGGFILMANSLTPLFYFISAIVTALLWISLAMVIKEIAKMQTHIELQTQFMQRMSKKPKSRK